MGRLRQKGKAGAAKAYVTRSAAVKKLQCSLADFRRLCILKGIFPREPRSRKKANKGSSAPTSFYYAKDIAYLAHEPVLKKLREHKAFAKKLSRALGRGEWGDAKSLEENKPVYHLDHIIKERYPTFVDAVRDIDDALCMIFLFAALPSNTRLPATIIENCSRLAAEWQLYIMRSHALRKTFLSIKGVYYQAEVMDQTITWLVPYQFTQNVPSDVDVRVMLTFLELYQTLLGFVFFKLYTDAGLIYPPPLDLKKDEGGAGVGAFDLQPSQSKSSQNQQADGLQASSKDVRQAIKNVSTSDSQDVDMIAAEAVVAEADDEEFVAQPSKSDAAPSSIPTLKSLSELPPSLSTSLFSSCTFFLSRETPRSIFEFLVRSFGGRIGWPSSSGAGSPYDETDEAITHVIIDRPARGIVGQSSKRKYVQPQWVVDCINQGKLLVEDDYAPGKTLPPHFSPFGEYEGAYVPAGEGSAEGGEAEEEESDVEEEAEADATMLEVDASNPDAVRAAELAAEAAGVEYGDWEKQLKKSSRRATKAGDGDKDVEEGEEDMNKMLMSNRQKKLYQKMVYSRQQKTDERTKLEQRRKEIQKSKRKAEKEKR